MIRRVILNQIQNHLSNPEITLIVGPRQAGKTTLMEILRDDLEKKGEKTLFLNLDFNADRPFFDSQEKLLQRISYEMGQDKGYVFIDEIQRKEDAGVFLKGLYDMKLPYKFIVSGSGSIELKEKIHESLPGRKRLFELTTLSFEEFVAYKQGRSFVKLATFFDLFGELSIQYLEEYLNFGGYPKVVLAPTIDEKRATIADIYQSFLEKDMSVLLNIQKTESLTALLRVLASQIGNLVNLAELSNTLGISVQTVKDYLWYLEKTYIISKVTPYFKNTRKEITKSPVYYFVDLGLRNFAANQFGNATFDSAGFLFENFVHNNLKNHLQLTPTTVHFWRTKDRAEVDFVLNTGKEVVPIEVKYTNLKKPETSRSFRSFLTKYKVPKAFIVNISLTQEITTEGTKVYFVPFFNTQIITKNI
ncbi:ATP-binding protein [Candidatus Daviesbacteria bacterium]|nr:ATP-binding protein [Candidatus Daviesbacteria bacterium]